MSSYTVMPTRPRHRTARLRGGLWVLLDMHTKRRGLYMTYTRMREADGSDGIDRLAPARERG